MSNARAQILAAIRHGLGRGALPEQAVAGIQSPVQQTAAGALQPRLPEEDPVAGFKAGLERVSGSLTVLPDRYAIPAAVAAYLEDQDIAAEIVVVAPGLQSLDWAAVQLEPSFDRARGDETTGVSQAFCGIAETGSLVLLSGADNPTTINFLPEHHLVILHQDDLVMYMEDVWARMQAMSSDWPRTINIITGPSRTADIEQTIQLGAHGPRRLQVLLVKKSAED